MPKWALFAARDGDVFRDEITLQSEESARGWAASRLADEFGLDDNARFDLDEAFGHCDGALLEVASCQPVAAILEKWATSQLGVLEIIGEELGEDIRAERRACNEALVRLAEAASLVV